MKYPIIQLQEGREASTGFHHPWIFSGAIKYVDDTIEQGDLVHITDRQGRIIGTGTYSRRGSIAVRLLAFEDVEIDEYWMRNRIALAHEQRLLMGYGPATPTTGYRVVFSEADSLPGLIIDRYDDVLVMQISTVGMDKLRPLVISACQQLFSPRAIIERSDIPARREEKLKDVVTVHAGEITEPVQFLENDTKLLADVLHGQKTGHFLDQRDLRQVVRRLAFDRTVLNLFSYTGATSLMALLGGTTQVRNVDASSTALALVEKQAKLNDIDLELCVNEESDVFQWLNAEHEDTYGMVILDPPALMKNKREAESARKAYHFLNRAALRLVEDNGIFVTSSCSRFFTEEDLAFVLRRASVQVNVQLDVLDVVKQAPDHPMSVYFPESKYLKSFICRVRRDA